MLENNILHNKLYKMSSFGLIDEKVLHRLVCLMRFSIIPSLYIYTGQWYKRDYRKGQTLRKDVSSRALWPSARVIYLCMYVQYVIVKGMKGNSSTNVRKIVFLF